MRQVSAMKRILLTAVVAIATTASAWACDLCGYNVGLNPSGWQHRLFVGGGLGVPSGKWRPKVVSDYAPLIMPATGAWWPVLQLLRSASHQVEMFFCDCVSPKVRKVGGAEFRLMNRLAERCHRCHAVVSAIP
jgi:hypothetical protein